MPPLGKEKEKSEPQILPFLAGGGEKDKWSILLSKKGGGERVMVEPLDFKVEALHTGERRGEPKSDPKSGKLFGKKRGGGGGLLFAAPGEKKSV